MKRVSLYLVCMLCFCAFPISGAVSKVSLAGFYAFESMEETITILGTSSSADVSGTSIGLAIKGTSYRSPSSNLGFSYTARVGKVNTMTIEGNEIDVSDYPIGWDIGIGIAYQQPVAEHTLIEAGGGIQIGRDSQTENSGGNVITTEIIFFYLSSFLEVNYSITDTMFFNLGLNSMVPMGGNVTIKNENLSLEGDIEATGFLFAPYVGLSFAY